MTTLDEGKRAFRKRLAEPDAVMAPLRQYAVAAPADGPPEILPWDHADRWGLDGAARAALGLLVEGEEPGTRLFEIADYLLTFCIEGYGVQQYSDAPLLNGTALALCGYWCAGAHPEAELWRVTGCARLATEVHARKAALEDRMVADCLLAVCRAAEETEQPILADLVTLRERMWGQLLNHGRTERLHVPEEEYPLHMTEPVPAERVGERMAARDWQRKARTPAYLLEADIEEAEGTCRNLLTLRAHMRVRHQFGSDIDWHLRLFDDVESTVSVCAQTFIRNLTGVYAETGDEEYARHAARLLWSFYRQCPLPNHRQHHGPWRTLELGSRQALTWPNVIGYLGETFDAATHAMLARSRLEQMRYLLAYCGGASNWYQVESAGLATAALFSPELKHADAYLRVAMRRLKWINRFAYCDDGFQFELSHLYHVFPTSSMFAVVRTARARGVELPGEFVERMEKAHEMYLYAIQPDYRLPMFNDNNPQLEDPAPLLRAASEVFAREDFRWGGTHGEEGQEPDHASHAWPAAGYYAMRNKWGPDGQCLYFDGGPFGASHQHEDKLSFTLYAHGRLLLGDPNIYSYARTELTHYFCSSRGHNVVLVDGKGQARRFRPEARLSTLGRNEWVSRKGFDFVSSEYQDGFALDPYDDADVEIKVDHGISHRRAIFYVKTGYWILCDLIRGEDAEEHALEQLFHLAPIHDPDASAPMRAGEVQVSSSAVVTQDEGLGNLAILPVDQVEIRAQKGETSPAVGWYGVLGEFPSWDVTLECRRVLPSRLDAVLYPLAPGESDHPTVTRLRADGEVTAFRIRGAGVDDTFVLCEEESGPVEVEDVTFEGRALLLRRKPRIQALAVNPRTVVVEGTEIEVEK